MVKVVGKTFLALLVTFLGFFLMYYYISGIEHGRHILLFLASFPLIGGGIYLLFRTGKSDATVVKKMNRDIPSVLDKDFAIEDTGLENTIKKGNALTQEWAKTNEARNRLKILQVSAEAQEKN